MLEFAVTLFIVSPMLIHQWIKGSQEVSEQTEMLRSVGGRPQRVVNTIGAFFSELITRSLLCAPIVVIVGTSVCIFLQSNSWYFVVVNIQVAFWQFVFISVLLAIALVTRFFFFFPVHVAALCCGIRKPSHRH